MEKRDKGQRCFNTEIWTNDWMYGIVICHVLSLSKVNIFNWLYNWVFSVFWDTNHLSRTTLKQRSTYHQFPEKLPKISRVGSWFAAEHHSAVLFNISTIWLVFNLKYLAWRFEWLIAVGFHVKCFNLRFIDNILRKLLYGSYRCKRTISISSDVI